ncbi:hypothetical protein MKW94_018575 [Papaver nudicaule]|uniref:Uncharacterized protein n=1 Tax=Papaver nudicaule TaxID=74823 RepID=A0AA41SAV2_PAPNU|nr:hypothetical protein [Papaver nudicaule]
MVPPSPSSPHLDDANPPPPPSESMPEASSNTSSSLIGQKRSSISISPSEIPSEISVVDLEHQSSSSAPRKVIKKDIQGIINCWYIRCGCKVNYRIKRVEESSLYRITGGDTTIEVPFNKDHVHFDCPCGCRCELTMGVKRAEKNEKEEKKKWTSFKLSDEEQRKREERVKSIVGKYPRAHRSSGKFEPILWYVVE